MVPRKEMEKDLKGQEKELADDIANLTKKVRICLSLLWMSATAHTVVKILGETIY